MSWGQRRSSQGKTTSEAEILEYMKNLPLAHHFEWWDQDPEREKFEQNLVKYSGLVSSHIGMDISPDESREKMRTIAGSDEELKEFIEKFEKHMSGEEEEEEEDKLTTKKKPRVFVGYDYLPRPLRLWTLAKLEVQAKNGDEAATRMISSLSYILQIYERTKKKKIKSFLTLHPGQY